MNNKDIAQIQGWLNEVITCQGTMQHKLQRAASMYQLNETEIVADTRDVSIYSRIHVYTSGYVMRLLECIHADFPVLMKFMGEEVFNQFAKASLMWSPSTSYSLYDLGDNFIRFLESTRPPKTGTDDLQNIFLELPVEIARVERARQEVLRAQGLEGIASAELFSPEMILFAPQEIYMGRPASIKLLSSKFSLKPLFDQFNQDSPYEFPEVKPSYLAISRLNYRLQMEELEEWQYYFLSFCEEGVSLMDVVQRTAEQTGIPASTLMAELFIWLPIFVGKGFVYRVDVPELA